MGIVVRVGRKQIPTAIKYDVLYRNAELCCVCRRDRARQLHHINENPSDNRIENIACLCLECHSEAHTDHKLVQNLTPERLASAKLQWESEVAAASQARILSENPDTHFHRAWCYFNFSKISNLIRDSGYPGETQPQLEQLKKLGLLDQSGFPISGVNRAEDASTIFQTLDFNKSHWLEEGFTLLVNDLMRSAKPLELARMWNRTMIKSSIQPGSLAFLNAGLYFRKLDDASPNEQRTATYTRNGITISFQFDTWNVSASSCLHLHFTGHRRVGVLVLIRSVELDPELPKSPLHLTATPIAMGVGFPLFRDRKPNVAFEKENHWIE